jgi:helix-turn-helix protein
LDQVDETDIAPLGEIYVGYKIEGDNKVQSIKIKEIKSIEAGIRTFQNITVDKTELLFKVIVSGEVSLLQYPKISILLVGTSSGGRVNKFGPPEIRYYAIKTNNASYVIKQKKDLKSIIQVFEDCQEAKAMIEASSFKLEDLKEAVTKLDNCK